MTTITFASCDENLPVLQKCRCVPDCVNGKRAGIFGLSLHANVFQIHGNGLSREYVGNLMLASSIEALPSTRLYELWLEQKFANGKVAKRWGARDSASISRQLGIQLN